MKKLIIYLSVAPLSFLHASSLTEIVQNIDIDTWRIALLVIFFIMIVNLLLFGRSIKKYRVLLAEKDEKITFLRKIAAQNEQKRTQKKHKLEKKILTLEHEIQTLEAKLKDGSKNQVVTKIEEYHRQRTQQMHRAGLTKHQES